MKYNQFAFVKTPYEQQVQELLTCRFLPADYESLSLSQLWAALVKNMLPEALTSQAKKAKLAEFAVDEATTLTDFLQTKPATISAQNFYNVALQLLGYHVHYDYELARPLELMQANALPYLDHDIADAKTLISNVYRLLNTRAKNGQLLIDVLAGKGYFTQFWGQGKFMFFNGKSLPVFDTSKVIREVVYVESDLDTDQDGQSDLLQVSIFRPAESTDQVKVPALYTASPYFGGIIANEKTNHNVDENLTDATTWTNPKYEAKPVVPAHQPGPNTSTATETAVHKSSYALNEYLLARGFACVFAGAIGTRGSDGLRVTGAPEETESAKEIIEWLHGDRIAYTDRSRQTEIKADWCNHQIGMTGRSYLGTLQIAIATTGVKGLKTVVSEAAISSWYDYYREHGLVIAPEACQGEDLDKLAETCQSNLWDAGSAIKIRPKYEAEQSELLTKEDRATGQYSDFWEARNYRHHTDGIKCSWISVHGLNDWNVKPKNVYKLWQQIKHLPVEHHLFLHQGPHYNINNLISIDFTDLMNLWFCHELLGIENHAYGQWATVLIQDNLHPDNWHQEDDWSNELGQTHQLYFHTNNELTETKETNQPIASFTDQGGAVFHEARISEADWQMQFLAGKSEWLDQQLRFVTPALTKTKRIVGRPTVHLRMAASRPVGQVSVALVELGSRQRLTPTPKFFRDQLQEFGFRSGTQALQEFVPAKVTPVKLITKAHMNLQNYADMKRPSKLEPGEFYDLEFQLQPTYYEIPTGMQLGLVVYSTDQGMTKRPLETEDYQLDLNHSWLTWSEE
ncbi:MAG: Xaa-Pro dipeptidyl-peptidase [Lactobacillus sp.]|jgi:X-Pro dipeptidyl-peptidase|nr:Xaa-Pro dipeptidyl-peptidase [Lactobacillus sp.]